jgi:hypothetical protein
VSDEYNYDIDLSEFEDEGFRVNFSDKEASAEARELRVMPRGPYHVAITDVSLEESKSDKNYGKPMFAFEFTIQEGDFKGQKLWTRAMLWEGALYTISQMLKAVGIDPNRGVIPPAEFWMGKHMIAIVKIVNKMSKNPETQKYDIPELDEKGKNIKQNDIAGFKSMRDWRGAPESASPGEKAKAESVSLLP